MFIVFEGVDGSGKTTQLRLLAEALRAQGVAVTTTREPGGSANIGPLLRELLLHSADDLGARAEALLFAADRAEHVRTVVEPALARGEVVLCDRFVDSTLAYQGHGRGLPADELLALCDFATAGRSADLVVVCDLDPRQAQARQRARSATDRMEAAGLGGHVRELLLSRAGADPDRYVVVDAGGTPEQVAVRVVGEVASRTGLLRLPSTPSV